MRSSTSTSTTSSAVVLVLVLVLGSFAFAQVDEGDEDGGFLPPMDPHGMPPGRSQGDVNRIHIPESRALEVRCRQAEAAEGAGEFAAAAKAYLEVLREERDPEEGVQRVLRVADGRYYSYARFARERLFALPEEGRKAFRELADAEARALFEDGAERRDRCTLETVWRTFPLSSVADEALERLGDLALEGGELDVAISRYERAAALPGGDLDPKRLAAKIARARAALDAAAARAARGATVTAWPVVGGDNEHAAPLPPLERIAAAPRIAIPLPASRAAANWGRVRRPQRFDGPYFGRDDAFAETVPVADEGRIVFTTSNFAACYDIATGDRRWYQGPIWEGQDRNPNIYYSATIHGGRVFAPFVKSVSRAEYYRGIPIKEEIPTRRLVAFDLASGKRLWDHAASAEEFLRRASVALPPIARQGVIYAGAVINSEGQIKCYAFACDAASGRLLWKRYLGAGQLELTMFGEHAIEPLAMQPAEHAGTIFHATGIGTVAAIDAASGELEWLAAYETIPIEAARTYYAVERELGWRNAPPLWHDGVLVVAPLDSDGAFGWDAATGALRWKLVRGSLRRLIGVHAGRVVFQGDRLHAFDLRSGKLVLNFPKSLEQPAFGEEEVGRGLVAGGVALVPLPSRIARVDLATGERLPEFPISGGIKDSGTLLYIGKDLFCVNPQRASAFQVMEASPPAPPAAVAPAPKEKK